MLSLWGGASHARVPAEVRKLNLEIWKFNQNFDKNFNRNFKIFIEWKAGF